MHNLKIQMYKNIKHSFLIYFRNLYHYIDGIVTSYTPCKTANT